MQIMPLSKRKFGSAVSTLNAGRGLGVYLKMKIFVSSPRLYIVGKYSPTPYLNVSIGIGRVFYTGIVSSV